MLVMLVMMLVMVWMLTLVEIWMLMLMTSVYDYYGGDNVDVGDDLDIDVGVDHRFDRNLFPHKPENDWVLPTRGIHRAARAARRPHPHHSQ